MPELTATDIIHLLEEPTDQRFLIKKRITKEASGEALVGALQQATNALTRQILCDIAGNRLEQSAALTLTQFLEDTSVGVRASSVDALGKIGDAKTGSALFDRFAGAEQDNAVLTTLALALGAVGYRPAIPLLTKALEAQDSGLRSCAAWSLGIMGAIEAEDALRAAILKESEPPGSSRRKRMEEALEALEMAHKVTSTMPREEAISFLVSVLKRRPIVVVQITAAAWALGKLGAKEGLSPLTRLLARYSKGSLAAHLRAAIEAIQKVEP